MAKRNGETDLLQEKTNGAYIPQTELIVSKTNSNLYMKQLAKVTTAIWATVQTIE